MTLVCVPVGRGNWKESVFQVPDAHAGGPLHARPGLRFDLLGITWRVVRVEP